jgi:amidophosphoribosyltransferase
VPAERKKTSVDTELVVRLIEQTDAATFEEALLKTLALLEGTYCFFILYRSEFIAVRDPSSNRPLKVGRRKDGSTVFASETCCFGTLGARWDGRSIEPGTMVRIDAKGEWHERRFAPAQLKRCSFEKVYFESPASHFARKKSVRKVRFDVGVAMEREFPVPHADVVVPVPDSAIPYAMGWGSSGRSGECVLADLRHHHAGGRTFILPDQDERVAAVHRKHILSQADLEDMVVVLVDDSIVRGTTFGILVPYFRDMGAKEVHGRIAYDRITHPCIYGIDTPTEKELTAPGKTNEEIAAEIGLDSLKYFPIEKTLHILGGAPESWCTACVTGNYCIGKA